MRFAPIKMRNKKGRAYRQAGFTLFELLITMAIIGILAAVIGGSFGDAQRKGRDARRISDMDGLQKAAEMYYALSGSYPTAVSGDWTVGTKTVLEMFPTDPKSGNNYVCDSLTAAGYCCCATMENTNKANSNNSCNFGAVEKTHYCVKNQQ